MSASVNSEPFQGGQNRWILRTYDSDPLILWSHRWNYDDADDAKTARSTFALRRSLAGLFEKGNGRSACIGFPSGCSQEITARRVMSRGYQGLSGRFRVIREIAVPRMAETR
jgi:hypothetical protein